MKKMVRFLVPPQARKIFAPFLGFLRGRSSYRRSATAVVGFEARLMGGGGGGRSQWSSLPPELLEQISSRLSLPDFLAFRQVCTEWRLAPTTLSVDFSSAPASYDKTKMKKKMLFMFYGGSQGEEEDRCFMYNQWSTCCLTVGLPQLRGATCLASMGGWLLLVAPRRKEDPTDRRQRLFFFNPFSRSLVHLPLIPTLPTEGDCTAAFAPAPSASDCIVVVASRPDPFTIEFDVLRRGDKEWRKFFYEVSEDFLGGFRDAVLLGSVFYVSDSDEGCVTYDIRNETAGFSRFVVAGKKPSVPVSFQISGEIRHVDFRRSTSYLSGRFGELHVGDWFSRFGGEEKCFSISTCAAVVTDVEGILCCMAREHVDYDGGVQEEAMAQRRRRTVKGVWIEPKVARLPPDYRW